MTYYLAAKLALGAAALAGLPRARREPAQRAVSLGLLAVLLLDLARWRWQTAWPPRLALAVYLAAPGVSVWVSARAFREPRPLLLALLASLPFAAWALLAPEALAWWTAVPAAGFGVSILLQDLACFRFYAFRGPGGPAQRAALLLLAGDFLALVLGRMHPQALPAQAVAVYLLLVPVQFLGGASGGVGGRAERSGPTKPALAR